MKYTTAILSGLMAATAIAQPHVRHQHAARHEKRDIIWYTDIEMVTETVDYTTTVWVSSGQLAAPSTIAPSTSVPSVTPTTLATIPKSSAAASSSVPKSAAASTSIPKSAAPSTSIPKSTAAASSTDGALLNQKISSLSSSFVAPPSSTSISFAAPSTTHTTPVIVPTTSSTSVAPVVPSSTSVAPVVISSTSSVVPVIVPTISSIIPAIIPSSTTAAAIPATTAASSSSGGICNSGSPCSGDITFYAAGLGACGETTDGSTFAGVALPVGLMGSQSNGNPYCGKTITINHGGKTAQATVIDKCMGCLGNSIDLTNFVFDQLAAESVGRTQATWFFND